MTMRPPRQEGLRTRRARRATLARLLERDRVFLNEYVQFGLMHHVVAAEALRSAYERAEDTAAAMHEQIDRTDAATARATAIRRNDGARVQTIVVARLVSELVAAIEDLGALMHAIRHRGRRGILVEYLESQVASVGDMLDLLIEHGGGEWPALLNLPDLESAAGIEDDVVSSLRHDYENLGRHLQSVGIMYRDTGQPGVKTTAIEVPPDQVAIILAIGDGKGEDVPRKGGVLAQAHNKIKHRFAVAEDIRLYREAGGPVTFGHYPRDPTHVRQLVANVTQVALLGAELCALVLTLDRVDPIAGTKSNDDARKPKA